MVNTNPLKVVGVGKGVGRMLANLFLVNKSGGGGGVTLGSGAGVCDT